MIKESYQPEELIEIYTSLSKTKIFYFKSLPNGLFPAAITQKSTNYTKYNYVWVRDNIYIALSHYLNGMLKTSLKNIKTLSTYFMNHQWRFENTINSKLDYNIPMNRPHIRFNGEDLSEINQKWAHAQNDALGYFLWLFCKIHFEMNICLTAKEKELLTLFVLFFETISYWKDEDSGHWEEIRKTSASSIAVATGGLTELDRILKKEGDKGFIYQDRHISSDYLRALINKGKDSLQNILPFESNQSDIKKNRRFDAALLFTIFPINIVSKEMSDQILQDVIQNLQGDYGIRRYLKDSFWSANYKINISPDKRTIDVSDDSSERDSFIQEGEEAQWCIFDPIISIIYGIEYKKSHNRDALYMQTHYLNRSLGQITGDSCSFGSFKCPELYFLENGRYVPNDVVPLLWTQANLWMAFKFMFESLYLNQ